jgi:pimeloyl-ACP methyl ester carboxylesterase
MSKTDQQLRLTTGRLLAYDEHGEADGAPIFYFHGSPSARLEWYLFGTESLAKKLKIRVIVPDRPGLGRSDFQPSRRIGDWPADVIALADHLALSRFAVVGYSGGGPYAAACALTIPERLTQVGIVSGTGPFDEPGLSAAINPSNLRFIELSRTTPWLSRMMLRLMGVMVKRWPSRFVTEAMAGLPAPDQAMLAQPDFQRTFIALIKEGLRSGSHGAQLDSALMASPWDFRPQEIQVAVHLWHGEVDANAPLAMGQYLAKNIPNCRASFYPGEGHLSLMAKHVEEILNVLAA